LLIAYVSLFVAVEIATKALNLNQIEFRGHNLRFSRPKSYTGGATHCVTWNELLALGIDAVMNGASGMPAASMQTLGGGLGSGMIGGIGVPATSGRSPTRCVQLSNMVTQEDLDTDENYDELMEDVVGEMNKYAAAVGATVIKVEIPKGTIATEKKEGDDNLEGTGIGNIYVEFSTLEACVKAFMDLPTRKFGESYIKAAYYPEDTMAKNIFQDIVLLDASKAKKSTENEFAATLATQSGGGATGVVSAAVATADVSSFQPLPSKYAPTFGGQQPQGQIPCKIFNTHGQCKFGSECRFAHVDTSKYASTHGSSSVTVDQGGLGARGIGGSAVSVAPPVVDSAAPVGRGRGRGRTLPAWMTTEN
jgi:hypothetical protein